MNMRMMDKLSDMLYEAINDITEKGKMSMSDLDVVFKATAAVENICKIYAMEYEKRSGSYGDSYRDNSHDDNSYRSRHWVRGHYSMSDGRREMMDRMQSMMDNEDMSMAERNSFARAMDALAR